jgi:hypothetical protein
MGDVESERKILPFVSSPDFEEQEDSFIVSCRNLEASMPVPLFFLKIDLMFDPVSIVKCSPLRLFGDAFINGASFLWTEKSSKGVKTQMR